MTTISENEIQGKAKLTITSPFWAANPASEAETTMNIFVLQDKDKADFYCGYVVMKSRYSTRLRVSSKTLMVVQLFLLHGKHQLSVKLFVHNTI